MFEGFASEKSDAFNRMKAELDADRRRIQREWTEQVQVHRRSLAQRIDALEAKMRAIQDARDADDGMFVDLAEVFENMWDSFQDDRQTTLPPREDRPRYTYDPQTMRVRLAYEKVNWQKEGF